MSTKYWSWVLLAAIVALPACDTPLDTDPTASIDSGTALNTARGIELGLNGAYRSLQSGSLFSLNHIVYPDLYADNLDFTGTFQTDREVGLRSVSASNGAVAGIWSAAYSGINRVNNILDAIPGASGMDDADRDLARGEALFIRALHYSVLALWFGAVPLVLEPSEGVGEGALVARNTRQEVYARIEADLEETVALLPAGRVNGRATQGAANALLARVYLENEKYAQARDKATTVISSGTYTLVGDYRDLFDDQNTSESIFELQYSVNNQNSAAFWFFPQALGGRFGFGPSASLFNAYEAGDDRRDASIALSGATRFGNKYFRIANGDDNIMVVRLAELYLIRAEANLRLGGDAGLIRDDLNVLRNRSGLGNLPTSLTDQTALLDAILQEARVEFAMEGHRFFDLRRNDRAEQVLAITADRLLFPIPQGERDVNPNLTQNPGY